MDSNKKLVINIDTQVDTQQLDKTNESVDKLQKNAEKTSKTFGGMADGAKKVSVGLKSILAAAGIIALLSKLADVFMSNQKVADTFATVMGTINIVLTKVVDVVVGVVDSVSKATNGFEGLTNVLKGMITLAITPLKLSFYAIKLAIQELQLAWEKSFFGSKDQSRIAELEKGINSTKEALVEVGEKAVESGKLVVNNLGKAIDEVGQVVNGVVDGISKIDVKAAAAQAEAQVKLQNNAKLAEAAQGRLAAQYERQGEKLRQIRDDDTKSLDSRIKANTDLKDVLDKQEKAMLGQADAQIAAAQANYNVNKSIENQVALTTALANKDGVLADIEGKRSEQKQNSVNLTKEQIALNISLQKSDEDRANKEKDFQASLIVNDLKRLETQKKNLEELKNTELVTLKSIIDNYSVGTQARIDAENAYKDRKQEIDDQILAKEKEIKDKRIEVNNTVLQSKIDANNIEIEQAKNKEAAIEGIQLQSRIDIITQIRDLTNQNLQEQMYLELTNVKLTEEQRANIIAKYNEQIVQNSKEADRQIAESRLQAAQQGLEAGYNLANALSSLDGSLTDMKRKNLKKGSEEDIKAQKAAFKRQKALSIVMAAIDGAKAVTSILAQYPKFDGGIAMAAALTAAGISVAAQVASIKSKEFNPETGDTGGDVSPTTTSIPMPTGMTPGQTSGIGQSQLYSISNDVTPLTKVYVVESDIKDVGNRVSVIENRAKIKSF